MSFVLVSADCSCCKPATRDEIYQQLAATGWRRLNGAANDPICIWLGWLTPGMPEEQAMAAAKDKFYSCFNPNSRPAVAFHWGVTQQSEAVATIA